MSTSDEDFGYACGRLAAVAGWLDVPWSTPDSVTVAISQTKNLREVVLNRLGHDVQEPQWEDDVPTLTMAAWLLEVTVDDAVVGDLPDRSPVITTCLRLGVPAPVWAQIDKAWMTYLREAVLCDEGAELPVPDVSFLTTEQAPVVSEAFVLQAQKRLG